MSSSLLPFLKNATYTILEFSLWAVVAQQTPAIVLTHARIWHCMYICALAKIIIVLCLISLSPSREGFRWKCACEIYTPKFRDSFMYARAHLSLSLSLSLFSRRVFFLLFNCDGSSQHSCSSVSSDLNLQCQVCSGARNGFFGDSLACTRVHLLWNLFRIDRGIHPCIGKVELSIVENYLDSYLWLLLYRET